MQLNVKNKARAEYIYEQWKTIPTPEQKKLYINELRRKKVITDEVLAQIKELKAKDK